MKSGNALLALTIRDWGSRIGHSPAEALWTLFEPTMHMLFYLMLVGLAPRRPHTGDSFALFFATGLVPYFLWQRIFFRISISMNMSTLFNFARVTFVDMILSRIIIELILWICNIIIVAIVIYMLGDRVSIANYVVVFEAVLMFIFLGMSWGVLSGFLVAFIPFWPKAANLINRCMYFSCGIFFVPDHLPPFIRDVVYWNPLLHVIEFGRSGVYYGYDSLMLNLAIPLTVSLVMIAIAAVIQHTAMERFRSS
ncbi:ABC transporter permease [Pinisolibacter sp. B13]|uniref:ABC transporter permease n=1 Tax=Pinisolibacter aquiterrae TaxID=2815579 RepID=UPI001C3DD7A3|nr:ABC transporter permease [Pinisolibacter aquiterrae]MBV5265074.1 ABC transporter permease [Pinisolibacter aquiterrae]